jgi:hypothetical protein
MVKQYIAITIIFTLMLITTCSFAVAKQKHLTVNEFYGTYQAVSLMKTGHCYSTETREVAEKCLDKTVKLSTEYFNNFWSEVQNPKYNITQQTSIMVAGEVHSELLRWLFQLNGIYEDQITLLKVFYSSENLPFEYLEIVDSSTLFYGSGCWTYTLKRIK